MGIFLAKELCVLEVSPIYLLLITDSLKSYMNQQID